MLKNRKETDLVIAALEARALLWADLARRADKPGTAQLYSDNADEYRALAARYRELKETQP